MSASKMFAVVLWIFSLLAASNTQCTICPGNEEYRFGIGCELPVYPLEGYTRIHEIQGRLFSSPLEGMTVTTLGVVTAMKSNGFYLQDVYEDCDEVTSEGIFVFFSGTTPSVGEVVEVTAVVAEFVFLNKGVPDGLVVTQLTSVSSVNVIDPGPVSVTAREFNPPENLSRFGTYQQVPGETQQTNILDLSCTDLSDALCYYEAYEGMVVRISNPVATSPTNRFGEVAVTNGAPNSSVASSFGGLVLQPDLLDTFFGNVILMDDAISDIPFFNIGSSLQPVEAVVDFSFGNPKLFPLNDVSALVPAEVSLPICNEVDAASNLRVGSFNLLNFCAGDSRLDEITQYMATTLDCPHVYGLQELGDDSCASSDGTVSGMDGLTQIANKLNTKCSAAGQNRFYVPLEIAPEDLQDGGRPGLNIRVAILYDANKLTFMPLVQPSLNPSNTGTEFVDGHLTINPGRISPEDSAFDSSRKPLIAEFDHFGQQIFVLVHHWNSKGGDESLWFELQPPEQNSQAQRQAISDVISSFVSTLPSTATIISVGDYNDFYFSEPLVKLEQNAGLVNMWNKLQEPERYSYVFNGRFQTLDHIIVNDAKFDACSFCVHHGSTLRGSQQISDHDPLVVECAGFPGNAGTIPPATATLSSSPSPRPTPTGDSIRAWINEFHYDNGGADSGEFVEIAGDASLDPSSFRIFLYNGNGGAVYNDFSLPAAWLNVFGGFGFVSVSTVGLQNGSPDGIALVGPGDVVIEFISYEGSFTGTDGPAVGMTSVDIGVAESGASSASSSIGRTGTAAEKDGFAWERFDVNTRDAVNTGQTIVTGSTETTSLTAIPSPTPTAIPSSAPTVTPSSAPTVTLSSTITTTPSSTITAIPSTTSTAAPSSTPTAAPSSTPTAIPTATASSTPTMTGFPTLNTAWVNEFRRVSGGFVEIAAHLSSPPKQYTLFLYNGHGSKKGRVYCVLRFSGSWRNPTGNYGFALINTRLRKRSGIALVYDGEVIDFISDGRRIRAKNGPAKGMISINTGVKIKHGERKASVGRTGAGSEACDFRWTLFSRPSKRRINAGQFVLGK